MIIFPNCFSHSYKINFHSYYQHKRVCCIPSTLILLVFKKWSFLCNMNYSVNNMHSLWGSALSLQSGVQLPLAWWLLLVNLASSLDFCYGRPDDPNYSQKWSENFLILIEKDLGVLSLSPNLHEWVVILCSGHRICQIVGQ